MLAGQADANPVAERVVHDPKQFAWMAKVV
jgi:hypothetical protein